MFLRSSILAVVPNVWPIIRFSSGQGCEPDRSFWAIHLWGRVYECGVGTTTYRPHQLSAVGASGVEVSVGDGSVSRTGEGSPAAERHWPARSTRTIQCRTGSNHPIAAADGHASRVTAASRLATRALGPGGATRYRRPSTEPPSPGICKPQDTRMSLSVGMGGMSTATCPHGYARDDILTKGIPAGEKAKFRATSTGLGRYTHGRPRSKTTMPNFL